MYFFTNHFIILVFHNYVIIIIHVRKYEHVHLTPLQHILFWEISTLCDARRVSMGYFNTFTHTPSQPKDAAEIATQGDARRYSLLKLQVNITKV